MPLAVKRHRLLSALCVYKYLINHPLDRVAASAIGRLAARGRLKQAFELENVTGAQTGRALERKPLDRGCSEFRVKSL